MNNTPQHADAVYLSGIDEILERGVKREDRTGVGTLSVFGMQRRYDISHSFPLLTTKKVYPRGVFGELIFFLNGITNNDWLRERNIHIWDEWAKGNGDLGPIYGYQWRHSGAPYMSQEFRDKGVTPGGGVDQLMNLIRGVKEDPFSRRHIVSAWNPSDLDEMALPPCHTMFQLYVTPGDNGEPKYLSCQLYQRSGDYFLGVPFNVASYAALTYLIADLTGLKPLEFIHTLGDAHIYSNHMEQIQEQLSRRNDAPPMPTLKIHHPVNPDEVDLSNPRLFSSYEPENFVISDYKPLGAIKAPVAV